ncbi:MAG: SDR family oxidoreductase [Clostridiales bacterium]|jgi:NAD(P)-dependent dehydrogenase (short-subunit alcohol dehydrogenase family)|nr:SDR family oxidoreductase [Clostridiales bacterium]
MGFSDKVCVITGGSNGIGFHIAEGFLNQGAKAAIIDKDDSGVQILYDKYGGSKVLFYQGDISNEHTLVDFASKTIEKFNYINFLINNACLSKQGVLSGCSFDDFNYVLKTGVTAPYYLAKLFLNNFAPNSSIVNIASTRAFMSQPDTESYTAAKGAIVSLTHALAASLKNKVRVNCISPGWIETDILTKENEHTPADRRQHLAGRVGDPTDILSLVLFLCSNKSNFIDGQNITIDGGMTKNMIYHNDNGWAYSPEPTGER